MATVLIIDDENDVAMMAQEILETGGFTVLIELDPRKGVALYTERSSDIDVVVLDLTMPEMSGSEVVESLQRIDPGVKIIISSGYSEQDVIKQLGGAKVAGVIQKPYRMQSLVSIVQKIAG